jgi:hypothetical protein
MIAVTSATAGNWAEAEPRSVADFPALMMARANIRRDRGSRLH